MATQVRRSRALLPDGLLISVGFLDAGRGMHVMGCHEREASAGPSRVLIVDADEGLAKALALRLVSRGVEARGTSDAHLASRMAVQARPEVIVLDMDMPGFGGPDMHAVLSFSQRARAIPVIYTSAEDSIVNRRRAIEQGARAFLVKPFDLELLLATLREVCGVLVSRTA